MKLSLHLLSEYVTFLEKDPERIAAAITASIGEVDDVEVQGALLEHCCIGKVCHLRKHQNADKLSLCDVETDKGVKKIVCGGTNLKEGMFVAFAHTGATVRWHGTEMMTLAPVKIRGEQSEGMICAAEELDLTAMFPPRKEDGERPVVALNIDPSASSGEKWKIGSPLREVLGLDDVVFHVDNHAITHRADLFSHIGFARECVAIGIAKWKPGYATSGLRHDKKIRFPKKALPFRFLVEEKRLMPRYCGCLIEIDAIGETPEWMKKRLLALGWRSVNLPVDITNYVAAEVGVPLHSFDCDDLRGDVHMRTAKAGEPLQTLDNKTWKLPAGALVLSDDEGIFDMLGIMGGLRSSTKASTRRIYLHSASLDPVSIRSTVIATGHRTDAATVYEKGVPPIVAEQGFLRAVELMLELIPGAHLVSTMESFGENGVAKPIAFSTAYCAQRLGIEIPKKQIVSILESLGCSIKTDRKGDMAVTPPLWRLKDLRGPHDLVEEVGRVYGYSKIDPATPQGFVTPPAREQRIHFLRDALACVGYSELLPLSLVGSELLKKCQMHPAQAVTIGNPIGEEVSLMQPCVIPQLLEHASRSMLLVDTALKTFHIGNIFSADGSQTLALGALLASRIETTGAMEPFLRLKRDVIDALGAAGYDAGIEPPKDVHPTGHPGRSASIVIASEAVGRLFELHPSVRAAFDLPHRSAAITIDLDALLGIAPQERHAKPVALYPAITYDVTMTLDRSKALQKILEKIRKSSTLLESATVADVYAGKPLGKDQYNVTIRCTYRSPERTLTEEEVKKEHEKLKMEN